MEQTNQTKSFVVCIRNEGYEASLEIRKIYERKPDSAAAKHNFIRVIDESGEGYLYPAFLFVAIDLPQDITKAIAQAS